MKLKPITLTDNEKFFEELGGTYVRHENGFFVLAPSGAGKTHFCRAQEEQHWIDGDYLWENSGAQPLWPWWEEPMTVINRVEKRCDLVTSEAKEQGFWVIGASNYWLKPDAIVVPDWETHVSYIKHREDHNYDGGAKSDALAQVKTHIEFIMKWHTDFGVPLFKSVSEAAESLSAD